MGKLTEKQYKLINDNFKFACSIAKKRWTRYKGTFEFDEFQESAYWGLVKAAKTYDPVKGEFIKYAGKAIDKYINDHLDDVKECNKKVYESILSNQKNYSEKIKVLLSEKTKTPKDNSIQTVTGESNDNKSNCTTITAESEDKKTNFGSKDL